MTNPKFLLLIVFTAMFTYQQAANGPLAPPKIREMMDEANRKGPYLGLVIPNQFEMNPLLQSPHFKPTNMTIDFSARRFRFGTIFQKQEVLVMTGVGMAFSISALLCFSSISRLLVFLLDFQVNKWGFKLQRERFGDGPEDELGLEKNGDYPREIGYLNFANYTKSRSSCSSNRNLLNSVWYQPEEVFPVDGSPEEREHAFLIPVDLLYFQISSKLESLELERCLNSTSCLTETPKVVRGLRGSSASIFLSNVAYQSFLYDTFNVSTVDMEGASVALICLQQRMAFITFRPLSGG